MQAKGIKSSRTEMVRDVLFLTAYTIWMLRAFFNTTFFYTSPVFVAFEAHALLFALCICLGVTILDFRFQIKEIVLLFLIHLLFWVAWANGAKNIALGVVLIYAARYVPFRKIAMWTAALQGILLAFVVTSSLLGVIENRIFLQGADRERYALGFLYCSYASHHLLLFFMLYLVIRKRIRWYEIAFLLVLNMVGFVATDTKTDILSIGVMVTAVLIFLLMSKRKVVQRAGAWMAFAVPFIFWGVSVLAALNYNETSSGWSKINQIVNNRLKLSHNAMQTYPTQWFGQKIKWVGGTAHMKDPSLVYNYVDNSYISVMLQLGMVFAFFMCLAYGRAIYIAIQKNQLMLAAGLFVFMVIGLVNPEMRNLLYNTFLLVLLKPADQYDGMIGDYTQRKT